MMATTYQFFLVFSRQNKVICHIKKNSLLFYSRYSIFRHDSTSRKISNFLTTLFIKKTCLCFADRTRYFGKIVSLCSLLEKFKNVPGNFREAKVPKIYQLCSQKFSVTFLKCSVILLVKVKRFLPKTRKIPKKIQKKKSCVH